MLSQQSLKDHDEMCLTSLSWFVDPDLERHEVYDVAKVSARIATRLVCCSQTSTLQGNTIHEQRRFLVMISAESISAPQSTLRWRYISVDPILSEAFVANRPLQRSARR